MAPNDAHKLNNSVWDLTIGTIELVFGAFPTESLFGFKSQLPNFIHNEHTAPIQKEEVGDDDRRIPEKFSSIGLRNSFSVIGADCLVIVQQKHNQNNNSNIRESGRQSGE